jgi:hypothetical protein
MGGNVGKVITGKQACKDCKYWGNPYDQTSVQIIGKEDMIYCNLRKKYFHPVAGVIEKHILCSERNKDGYCPDFCEKPTIQPENIEELMDPGSEPNLCKDCDNYIYNRSNLHYREEYRPLTLDQQRYCVAHYKGIGCKKYVKYIKPEPPAPWWRFWRK